MISVTAGLPFEARISKRTKRAGFARKVATFIRPSAVQVPAVASVKSLPSVLVRIRYELTLPSVLLFSL